MQNVPDQKYSLFRKAFQAYDARVRRKPILTCPIHLITMNTNRVSMDFRESNND